MALYVSAARRRRRTGIVGAIALVAGLLVGLLVGRSLGSSADEQVEARQRDIEQLVARLDSLDLEYQQTAAGGAGGTDALQGALDAARSISADTLPLLESMAWVPPAEAQAVTALVDEVAAAVENGASPEEVGTAVVAATAGLRAAAGLAAPPG